MMKRLIALVTLVGALLVPAAASAAPYTSPIKECGNGLNAGSPYNPVRNITVRNLNCREARRMVREYGFVDYGTGSRRMGRYTCRQRIPNPRSWTVDVRCTFWIYVLRWQYLSGE
jgi:hypothetical protein